jgi:hypothetical protein
VEKEVIVEKRVEIPVEVIKEVEKIVEVPVEVIKEVFIEKEVVKEVLVEIEKIVEIPIKNDEQVKKLEQQIQNLKIELELEQNRNYQPAKLEKPKEEKNKNMLGSIINWVSKGERDDLYGE